MTGSFGTGKSTVARMLASRGAKVLDADKIVHGLLLPKGPCSNAIVRKFGQEILKGGRIDRSRLAKVVFSDTDKLRQLEAILHPHVGKVVKQELRHLARGANNTVVVVEVPLLFESRLHRIFDRTVVVTADRKTQLARLKRKTRLAEGDILKRIKRQMPLAQKIVLADFVINNSGALSQTRKQVEAMWNKFSKI